MFALFVSLYYSMFTGYWNNLGLNTITNYTKTIFSQLGAFVTSIFGDNTYQNLGDYLTMENLLLVTSIILALITSIGIVVMAVKGIKRIFSVFFYGVR